MLVHSSSPQSMWFDQFTRFAALFGIEAQMDMVYPARPFDGLVLYLGWAKGDPVYLRW